MILTNNFSFHKALMVDLANGIHGQNVTKPVDQVSDIGREIVTTLCRQERGKIAQVLDHFWRTRLVK